MLKRRSVLVVILFGLLVLLVSPWASAPSLQTTSPVPPVDTGAAPAKPVLAEFPAALKATVLMDSTSFELLQQQNEHFMVRHPDIQVELTRIDPSGLNEEQFRQLLEDKEGIDLALVPGNWVRKLAVSGALLPADTAFVGEALSQQFGALITPMKWNDYLWGVPRSIDPDVIVWNRDLLNALHKEDGTAVTLPLDPAGWQALPKRLLDAGKTNAAWLAIDHQNPESVLNWLGAVTGQRADWLLGDKGAEWNGQVFEGPLTLLREARQGVIPYRNQPTFWSAFAAGKTLAAVVPQSEAVSGMSRLPTAEAASLYIDRSSWDNAYVWSSEDSFIVSAHTEHEEAARLWMAEMTDGGLQTETYKETGRLPVNRSLYLDGSRIVPNLADSQLHSFPNVAQLAAGAEVPERLALFRSLLDGWMNGLLTLPMLQQQWPASLSKLQTND